MIGDIDGCSGGKEAMNERTTMLNAAGFDTTGEALCGEYRCCDAAAQSMQRGRDCRDGNRGVVRQRRRK